MLSPSYIIFRIQRQEGKQCDPHETAHNEPPHQDLSCMQIQLLKELNLKQMKNFMCEQELSQGQDSSPDSALPIT